MKRFVIAGIILVLLVGCAYGCHYIPPTEEPPTEPPVDEPPVEPPVDEPPVEPVDEPEPPEPVVKQVVKQEPPKTVGMQCTA